MTSHPLDCTHGRTTSCVASHHRACTARTVDVESGMKSPPLESTHSRQHRAWHDITTLGQRTRSNDVARGMPSPPLDSTHGRTTSGVACHHRPWTTHTVGRCRAWHDITALAQHAQSDDIERGKTSPPLDRTHGRTSGVACHHGPWTTHMVGRCWA